jgi:hypothetical protein
MPPPVARIATQGDGGGDELRLRGPALDSSTDDGAYLASNLGCEEAPAGSVVATAFTSVDADCDNGTVLHGSSRFRRSYDLAVKRLGAQEGRRGTYTVRIENAHLVQRDLRQRLAYRFASHPSECLPPPRGPTQARTTPELMFCVRLDPDGVATVRLVA